MEKYSRNQQIIDGELDNHQVMMHIEKGKYFGLNPVGKRIWGLIEEPKGFSEIIQCLLSEFDATEEQCSREVQDFLDKAIASDIITMHDELDSFFHTNQFLYF
nr:PqqD family protein [uncultured Draconibacterium sp.]